MTDTPPLTAERERDLAFFRARWPRVGAHDIPNWFADGAAHGRAEECAARDAEEWRLRAALQAAYDDWAHDIPNWFADGAAHGRAEECAARDAEEWRLRAALQAAYDDWAHDIPNWFADGAAHGRAEECAARDAEEWRLRAALQAAYDDWPDECREDEARDRIRVALAPEDCTEIKDNE